MELPDALRRFRKYAKITQKQAALAAKISLRNYQDYEYGKVEPGANVLIALADHFNVSLDYLTGRSDDPRRHWGQDLARPIFRMGHFDTQAGNTMGGAGNMEILQVLGERLRLLRRERRLRQADMGELLGLTQAHYQRIEKGKINIPTLTLYALADYFGVSTDYLLGRSDKR